MFVILNSDDDDDDEVLLPERERNAIHQRCERQPRFSQIEIDQLFSSYLHINLSLSLYISLYVDL